MSRPTAIFLAHSRRSPIQQDGCPDQGSDPRLCHPSERALDDNGSGLPCGCAEAALVSTWAELHGHQLGGTDYRASAGDARADGLGEFVSWSRQLYYARFDGLECSSLVGMDRHFPWLFTHLPSPYSVLFRTSGTWYMSLFKKSSVFHRKVQPLNAVESLCVLVHVKG